MIPLDLLQVMQRYIDIAFEQFPFDSRLDRHQVRLVLQQPRLEFFQFGDFGSHRRRRVVGESIIVLMNPFIGCQHRVKRLKVLQYFITETVQAFFGRNLRRRRHCK